MVKIRLRRIGSKGRPFYRIVVAQSTAGRNGKFVEVLGTYDPIVKPTAIKVNEERALHWLMNGAQPTETTAIILNRVGVLPRYFEARPNAKKDYSFLDKRTAAISMKSAIETPAPAEEKAPKPEPAPVVEPTPEPVAETQVEEAEAAGETVVVDDAPPADPSDEPATTVSPDEAEGAEGENVV